MKRTLPGPDNTWTLLTQADIQRGLQEGRLPDAFVIERISAPCHCNMCLGDIVPRTKNNLRNQRVALEKNKIKRLVVFQRDAFSCVECDEADRDKLTIDHIVPLCDGGSNAYHNLQTLCRTCNGAKGRTNPLPRPKPPKKAPKPAPKVHNVRPVEPGLYPALAPEQVQKLREMVEAS